MADLFPDAPRRPRRVLMHVVDAGGCCEEFPMMVRLKCLKCGHNHGWVRFGTKREALSQPCPKCNAPELAP